MVIQSRIPAEDYFASQGLSISNLKHIGKSPLHYKAALEFPRSSRPMTLGTAAHCAALEPERFSIDYAFWDRRTEAGAASPRRGKVWDEFVAQHQSQTIITADEAITCVAIAKAVRGDPVASKYLESGEPEVVMRWKMRDRICRGRVDWLTSVDGEPGVVGLKTARDVRQFQFGAASARLGYHMQWAWYFDGYREITGDTPRMIEIAVESAPPHAVIVYVIPEDVIEQGRDDYLKLMEVLERCERLNEWPGPAETEQILTLPSWVYGAEDDDISDLGLEA